MAAPKAVLLDVAAVGVSDLAAGMHANAWIVQYLAGTLMNEYDTRSGTNYGSYMTT